MFKSRIIKNYQYIKTRRSLILKTIGTISVCYVLYKSLCLDCFFDNEKAFIYSEIFENIETNVFELEYAVNTMKSQIMYAFDLCPIEFVPKKFRSSKTYRFEFIPDMIKTQTMCDRAVEINPYLIKNVPKKFINDNMLDIIYKHNELLYVLSKAKVLVDISSIKESFPNCSKLAIYKLYIRAKIRQQRVALKLLEHDYLKKFPNDGNMKKKLNNDFLRENLTKKENLYKYDVLKDVPDKIIYRLDIETFNGMVVTGQQLMNIFAYKKFYKILLEKIYTIQTFI